MFHARTRLKVHYAAMFLFMGGLGNYLPIWFRHKGWSDQEIGLQGALLFACLCVFPLIWGHLTDRSGRPTRVLRFISLSCILLFLPFIFTSQVDMLIVATVGFFAFRTGLLTATDAMTLNFLAREGGDYGHIRLWGSLGFIAGGFLLGGAIQGWGVDAVPITLEVLLIVGAAVIFLLAPVPLEGTREEALLPALKRLLSQPKLRAFYAVAFSSRVASQGIYIFLPLHLQDIGVDNGLVPLYWAVGVLSEIVLLRYAPVLFGKRCRRNVLVLCFLLAALQHGLTALVGDPQWLLPIMLFHGFSFGVWFYISVTWLGDAVDETDRARAQGLFHTLGFGIGGVISAIVAGGLFEAGGGPLLFATAAGMNLLTAALAFILIAPRGHVGPTSPRK